MTLLFLIAMNVANPRGISIRTYRVAAAPGVILRYAGADYTVGPSGSIEIRAVPNESTLIVGGTTYNLPHDGPTDASGGVTVSVMPQSGGVAPPPLRKKASTRAA